MITDKHIDYMAKIILLTGTIVGYAYLMELFIAWYGGNEYEWFAFLRNRIADPFIFGPMAGVEPAPYWWAYWAMMSCNVIFPQFFWSKTLRSNIIFVWFICQFVNAGMWFERFVIIVTSIHRDFLPSSWGMFYPTWVDIWTFVGTFGLFLTLFLLFIKFLPMIAVAEVKLVTPDADIHHPMHHGEGGEGSTHAHSEAQNESEDSSIKSSNDQGKK